MPSVVASPSYSEFSKILDKIEAIEERLVEEPDASARALLPAVLDAMRSILDLIGYSY